MSLQFVLHHWQPDRLDPGKAFERFRRRTGLKPPFSWRPFAVAAAVILGAFLFYRHQNAWVEYAAYDTVQSFTLHDGTRITMAPGAKVALQPHKNDRLVTMAGQVHYSVFHDEIRPFTVRASGLEVQVLGTVFSVTERMGETRVEVAEGTVGVSAAGSSLILHAGEAAVLAGDELEKRTAFPNPSALSSGRFVYEAVPLEEVLSELSAFYGVSFTASPADGRLTAEFETDMGAERIAELISLAMHVEITLKKNDTL